MLNFQLDLGVAHWWISFLFICTFSLFILFLYFASLHDQFLGARFVELGLALSLTLDCTSVDQFSLDLQRNGSSGLQLITSDLALECNSSKWRFQLHFFRAGQKHTCWIGSDKENHLKNKKQSFPASIYIYKELKEHFIVILSGAEINPIFNETKFQKCHCLEKQS